MTVAKKERIQEMAQRLVPQENVATVIDSLGTAWRRAVKGSETKEPLPLGDFSRDRDDLTAIEARFVNQWLQKRSGIAPDTQPTPSPNNRDASTAAQTDVSAVVQKAIEKDRAKQLQEFETRLTTEMEALNSVHRAAIADLKRQLNAKEADAKNGLSHQERLLNNQIAQLSEQISKNEERTEKLIQQERERGIEKINALTSQYQKDLAEAALNLLNAQKTMGELSQKLVDQQTAHETELKPYLQQETERKKKVTVLELINYGEIVAALVGAVIMFKWVGAIIGFPAALFYYDAMRTVKKADSWQSAQFAMFVCVVLSVAFGFIHYNTALRNTDSEVYDKSYIAFCAAVILSGISVAALRQAYLKKEDGID